MLTTDQQSKEWMKALVLLILFFSCDWGHFIDERNSDFDEIPPDISVCWFWFGMVGQWPGWIGETFIPWYVPCSDLLIQRTAQIYLYKVTNTVDVVEHLHCSQWQCNLDYTSPPLSFSSFLVPLYDRRSNPMFLFLLSEDYVDYFGNHQAAFYNKV